MFRIWFVFVCFSLSLFSQDNSKLGEKEIRSSQRVRFINRSSVRAGEEVRGTNEKVGSSLAEVLKKEPGKTHSQGGISITRIAPEEKKFGADIFCDFGRFRLRSYQFDPKNPDRFCKIQLRL